MSAPATAHELLAHALRAHIETVRATMARVLSTAPGRRVSARKKGAGADTVADTGTGTVTDTGAGTVTDTGAGADTAAAAAAAADEDAEEAVHDFRVGLRRLRTALRSARKNYGKKRLREIGEGLKRYGDVTSALRDEEVLRQTLTKLKLPDPVRKAVDTWLARRAKQERVRRGDVVRLLRSGAVPAQVAKDGVPTLPSLEDCLTRLEKRLHRPRHHHIAAVDLGQQAIAQARADIDALGQVDPADVSGMHTLRIRFKRLRYTAELFAPALGEEAERTAKSASRLQSKLGDLHDFDQAMVRMARARGLTPEARTTVMEALRLARAEMALRCGKELAAFREPVAQRTIESDRATKS